MPPRPLNSVFYRRQADEAARLAAEAALPNVRNCLLEAEQAWRAMAAVCAEIEGESAIRRLKVGNGFGRYLS